MVRKTKKGCWLWTGYLNPDGYPNIYIHPDNRMFAHRFSYQLKFGKIKKGLQIDHLCRVRHCVNPKHLEPVTPKINQLRGYGIGGLNSRKTHCPKGHPYSGKNLYFHGHSRNCIKCMREATKRYEAKNK